MWGRKRFKTGKEIQVNLFLQVTGLEVVVPALTLILTDGLSAPDQEQTHISVPLLGFFKDDNPAPLGWQRR